jgi:hypothetical protein
MIRYLKTGLRIISKNHYQSADLDFVTTALVDELKEVLEPLISAGLNKHRARYGGSKTRGCPVFSFLPSCTTTHGVHRISQILIFADES